MIKILQYPYLYLFVVLIGVVLKFYKLEERYFWFDEVCTVQITSGIPDDEYQELLPRNEIKSISYYEDLMHLNKMDHPLSYQIKGLTLPLAQFTPLHYGSLIFWHRLVGDDYIDYRYFSIFIFIITLPFIFLLARALFGSDLAGWVAVSLYSISPFFHLYAQEARYYILWAFNVVLLHYTLLKAIKENRTKWWLIYSLAGVLALFSCILSGLMLIGHLVFIWVIQKEIRMKYTFYLTGIILVYVPWLVLMYYNREAVISQLDWQTGWRADQQFWEPIFWQLLGFSHLFVTLEQNIYEVWQLLSWEISSELLKSLIYNAILLILIVVAGVFIFRKSDRKIRVFILCILLPSMIYFYLSDMIRDSGSSVLWRYHVMSYIAIILIIANFITERLKQKNWIYFGILSGLVVLGIASILTISKNKTWHAPFLSPFQIEDARIVSEGNSLIITDFSNSLGLESFLELIAGISTDNIDILHASPDIRSINDIIGSKNFSSIYVMHGSEELVKNLKRQFGNQMDSLELWRERGMWKIEISENNEL